MEATGADAAEATGTNEPTERPKARGRLLEVLLVATRLGLTSFGGPVAHLGYFRDEYVGRRHWLDDAHYADLVALAQFLPGPASSQVGIAIGTLRAGPLGGLLAWIGFTLPSAIALTAFALLVAPADVSGAGWLHGLELVAVAVVIVALSAMVHSLAPDWPRKAIAVVAALVLVAVHDALAQVAVLAAGALIGTVVLRGVGSARGPDRTTAPSGRSPIGRALALACLALFGALLVLLPLASSTGNPVARVAEPFYASGSLVFGGGHVVLPLLSERVVDTGMVESDRFLAGYAAAQAVPGPLFTFAAYLGAALREPPNGIPGAAIALVAIFLPSFLLVWGALPFWSRLRALPRAAAALAGVNAAVVGLLAAALYDPIATSAIERPLDLAFVAVGWALLALARAPAWAVVLAGALAGLGVDAVGVG
jgi:chromate transporter